ncbi:hypothetical protein B0H13DRAFT_1860299 [Mycena leptocephala]|nr:hypothetical protein B0H13DRAFT_1860299 [Mycena leptocephala]
MQMPDMESTVQKCVGRGVKWRQIGAAVGASKGGNGGDTGRQGGVTSGGGSGGSIANGKITCVSNVLAAGYRNGAGTQGLTELCQRATNGEYKPMNDEREKALGLALFRMGVGESLRLAIERLAFRASPHFGATGVNHSWDVKKLALGHT